MKEAVVIGAGPAGLTASIYLKRQNIDFSLLSYDVGGQALISWQIENYTGYKMITGMELVEKFEEHVKNFGADMKENIKVVNISQKENGFNVKTDAGDNILTKAVLIATGSNPRKLNVKGENEFLNKGVAYCAICDAPLFKDKVVAVVGGGNSALDAARQLLDIATKVYLITIEEKIHGEQVIIDKVLNNDKTELLTVCEIEEILGNDLVNGIVVSIKGEKQTIPVQGVFIEIGRNAESGMIDLIRKNKKGEIIVDGRNMTSLEGIFAAGDVTDISKKQVVIAAGDGAKAALNMIEWLAKKK